jgi:hypothetical protein
VEDVCVPRSGTKTFACPSGTVRVHVRDIWSPAAAVRLQTASLQLPAAPFAVAFTNDGLSAIWVGRQDSASCAWYSACVAAPVLSNFGVFPLSTPCADDAFFAMPPGSGSFNIESQLGAATEVWLDYRGTTATVDSDYGAANAAADVGPNAFDPVTSATDPILYPKLCAGGVPDESAPSGYVKLHIRWPWGDPSTTGYPGAGCLAAAPGSDPFPSGLVIQGETYCNATAALLELADGNCPWYYTLIPASTWAMAGEGVNLSNTTPVTMVPSADTTGTEYWFGYDGPVLSMTACGTGVGERYAFFATPQAPQYDNCN